MQWKGREATDITTQSGFQAITKGNKWKKDTKARNTFINNLLFLKHKSKLQSYKSTLKALWPPPTNVGNAWDPTEGSGNRKITAEDGTWNQQISIFGGYSRGPTSPNQKGNSTDIKVKFIVKTYCSFVDLYLITRKTIAIKAVIFLRFFKFRWLAVCSSID